MASHKRECQMDQKWEKDGALFFLSWGPKWIKLFSSIFISSINIHLSERSFISLHTYIYVRLLDQSSYSVVYYGLELTSWNQENVRNDNFQCTTTEKAAWSRSGQREGKSLRDPGISKDKLCGILQKILKCGVYILTASPQRKGCLQRCGIIAPPSGRAVPMFRTQHFLKDSHIHSV